MEGYRELDGSSIRKIRQVVQDETRNKITLLPTWQDLRTNICRVVMGRHMRSETLPHRNRLPHRVITYRVRLLAKHGLRPLCVVDNGHVIPVYE